MAQIVHVSNEFKTNLHDSNNNLAALSVVMIATPVMAQNMTGGNMTGGNITGGNMTGKISGEGITV